ncbi:uroporphyrinogen-III C-methyltransferase [Lysobacter korlensis]|uniref:Uroporphyrinogen-III C-methyltransferase n=1 Tax=Lysobacter korlensis TaxID=553636 RepID=A0ABV6RKQ0_9GAMM
MPSNPSQRRAWWPWLLVLVLGGALAVGAWFWRTHDARQQARLREADQRLGALEQRLDAMRRDQRAQYQRLQHADATNRVLRDELLAVGQRAALLEDSVQQLAAAGQSGAHGLRLDEAELLLTFGLQRLQVAGDVEGARRAYALASDVIESVADPTLVSLRQTLAQERAALADPAAEPRRKVLARLTALGDALADEPAPAQAADAGPQPWWRRALSRIVRIRRSDAKPGIPADQRGAARAALQLELTLARAAVERRDAAAYRAALQRAEEWLIRLWSDSPTRRRHQAELRSLAATRLSPAFPTLGSTLVQLQQLRPAR